jgi:hypothetical protein
MRYEVTTRSVVEADNEEDAEQQVLRALENLPGDTFLVDSKPLEGEAE